ncbi:hypothetical protein NOF55_02875 [Rhizobiaceae bacterium BDR2-2]|uniref:Uncharacterized protein n=1 Tax=Ectorhizobium quercum TaxID=2965071 RepID=A0AAE3SUI8_9HYPH|nr:hypothetical protein [Ectorhizobium quercum]MCX8996039.1 hypothetical protein [Ectorhizobium quercum]
MSSSDRRRRTRRAFNQIRKGREAMKPMLIAVAIAAMATGARAEIVIEPDHGLTLVVPAGFSATLQSIDPAASSRLIGVKTTDADLPTAKPAANLCEIVFHYDATYGDFTQGELNALFLSTNHFEMMREKVVAPGPIEDSAHFTHNGSAAHHFLGKIDAGGAFVVSVIPSPRGFTLVSCVTANTELDPAHLQPLYDGLVVPGQPRDGLVPSGDCPASPPDLPASVDEAEYVDAEGVLIRALDAERDRIASQCDPLHADIMIDAAMTGTGFSGTYRDFREHTLSRAIFHQLSSEELSELEKGHEQMAALAGAETADLWMRHTLFILGRDRLLD